MTNYTEINSLQNNLVKTAVKLQDSKYRKEKKLIFADGNKTIEGFINDSVPIEYLFIKKENDLNLKNNSIKNVVYVTDEILKKITSVKTPSNCAAIIKEPTINHEIFKKLNRIALIENIKDAGNLGTIIRSAAAFSIDGIILFGKCIDLYNTKVIRATAQNIFKIPILRTGDINFILDLKKNHKIISTVVDSKENFLNYKFDNKFIIAFGSEACGLSEEIKNISNKKITLGMDNNVESLNLAVCASICFALINFQHSLKKLL